ncbi:MAG: hypothetical protein MUO27_06950 [Sedimentisphaerales bacterium]|nr:hypothetical protein [Sedimentisphaerales bacterium]
MNIVRTWIRGKGPKAAQRRRGLSIIEVAMASALLIVAMVPILKALTKAHMFASEIERKTQSLVLAQGKLDEIRARSIYHYSDSFAASGSAFGGSYLCNVEDTGPGSDLRTITVKVGYSSDATLSPDEVEVTLATYIARRW